VEIMTTDLDGCACEKKIKLSELIEYTDKNYSEGILLTMSSKDTDDPDVD